MPRVDESPPAKVVLTRGEMEFSVGRRGCDFSWQDLRALFVWRERFNMHNPRRPVGELPADHLEAMLAVMRVFPGSHVETPDEVTYGVRQYKAKPERQRWRRR